MKQCAVVLNGNDVIKVNNLKRKYDKIVNNPNMKILEECDMEMLDEKYNYWNKTLDKEIEEVENSVKLYHFKNPKTRETISTIYSTLECSKTYINDWRNYVNEEV